MVYSVAKKEGASGLKTTAAVIGAVALAAFIISASVVFTLNFRPLYSHDVGALDIPAVSGLGEAEIYENYDALIAYNSVFFKGELEFPSLAMSDSGRQHFAEVKHIFDALQIAMICAGLLLILCVIAAGRRRGAMLIGGGIVSVAVPAVIGLLYLFMDWHSFFRAFHGLLFDNDLWIFDADTDPVITMLPDAYFMHCLIMILAVALVISAICISVGGALRRKH